MLQPPKLPLLLAFLPLLLAFLHITRCFALAEDRPFGTDPLEPQFRTPETYPRDITEDQLRDLPLSDPKLRIAYAWLIKGAHGGHEITDARFPALVEVLKDVKRRGNTATPLWLDIMSNNHGSHLEYMIPHVLERVETIEMEPYVDYFRKMLQTRGDTINALACSVALSIFFEYGTKEDVQMVQELAKRRPFLAPSVEEAFETEQRRNAPLRTKPSGLETTPAPDQSAEPQSPKLAPPTPPVPSMPTEGPASSNTWFAVTAGFIVSALGLFWFLLNGKK